MAFLPQPFLFLAPLHPSPIDPQQALPGPEIPILEGKWV